jgi:hypothetical protein
VKEPKHMTAAELIEAYGTWRRRLLDAQDRPPSIGQLCRSKLNELNTELRARGIVTGALSSTRANVLNLPRPGAKS